MKMRSILHLRRTSDGRISMDALKQLGLPMPDDVLEQFLHDHGTAEHLLRQFGELDLHTLFWERRKLPGRVIIQSSVDGYCSDYVEEVAEQYAKTPAAGWDHIPRSAKEIEYWIKHESWMRPPVAIVGTLVASQKPFHWIEGHTRLGALKGLILAGLIHADNLHDVWVASSNYLR